MRRRAGAARSGRAAAFLAALLAALAGLGGLGAPRATAQPVGAPASGPAALQRGELRVVYWPGQRGRAERLLRAAGAPLPLPGLQRSTRLTAGTIVLVPTPAVWDSLTGGAAPAWAAGIAIPARRTILLPGYARRGGSGDVVLTLRHELAHLALHAALPAPIPRWFDEGYATWVSGEWDESSGWQLRLAFLLGRAPPLDSLTLQWPREAGRARTAYLLSAGAVRHLAERGGEHGFTHLLAAWQRQGSLGAALRSTYGMTLGQFEKEWRTVMRRRYGWLLLLSQWGVIWGVLAPLVVWLAWWQRRRRRQRLAVLEREYRMLPAVASPGSDDLWRVRPVPPTRGEPPPGHPGGGRGQG